MTQSKVPIVIMFIAGLLILFLIIRSSSSNDSYMPVVDFTNTTEKSLGEPITSRNSIGEDEQDLIDNPSQRLNILASQDENASGNFPAPTPKKGPWSGTTNQFADVADIEGGGTGSPLQNYPDVTPEDDSTYSFRGGPPSKHNPSLYSKEGFKVKLQEKIPYSKHDSQPSQLLEGVEFCCGKPDKEKYVSWNPTTLREGYDPINQRYWPYFYYSFPYNYKQGGAWPPGLFSKLYNWSPSFYTGSTWSYSMRPGMYYTHWPRSRWVRGNGDYYFINNR